LAALIRSTSTTVDPPILSPITSPHLNEGTDDIVELSNSRIGKIIQPRDEFNGFLSEEESTFKVLDDIEI